MRDGGVTDDELAITKAHFVDTFPHRFANKTRVVEALLDEEFTGRYLTDPDYFAHYRTDVEKLTKADVDRIAKRLLHPDSVTLLVVGNKADLLNPEPGHPVRFADLTGGRFTELPLRDPLTMKPLSSR